MRQLAGTLAAFATAGGVALTAPAMAHASTSGQTPCAPSARACVDTGTQQAWLTNGHGRVTYGPVPAKPGMRSAPTTAGTFRVQWKDINHHSHEFHGAPMPYSVFFYNGEAFHEGSLYRYSNGCVHLSRSSARTFYYNLHPGETVQVVR
jgi:lipoprotein-anchoring transpeptidase ErfK/SrfK